jgi:hypothetical protein
MAEEQREKMVRATVAQGHTIEGPVEGKKRVVGYFPGSDGTPGTGRPVEVAEVRAYGPGEEVMLTASDVSHLRLTGHLVDPDKKAPNYGPGPSFNRDVAPSAGAA